MWTDIEANKSKRADGVLLHRDASKEKVEYHVRFGDWFLNATNIDSRLNYSMAELKRLVDAEFPMADWAREIWKHGKKR